MEGEVINSSEQLGILKKYWIYVVLGIFVANSLILDIFFFFPKNSSSQTVLPGNINLPNISQNFCPQACLDQISLNLISPKATDSSLSVQPTIALASTPTLTPTPIPTSVSVNSVKEFFVPLGAGSGNSSDWKVIDGIGAKIDPADYGSIKQITFEVSARIPNGNQQIWIRLYNANTFQAVAGSDVTLSGGTPTLLISSPINLASGNNLYQIQMKTQLASTANIDMARIRIKTD